MHKFLLLSVCGSLLLSLSAQAFETKAKYAYLIDAETGYVMYDKKADVAMAPASMSKLMTAYVLFDALKSGELTLEDEFKVSENAWRKGGAKSGSSTMFLEPGQMVKVKDLLRGIIVQSGNDACIVAAEGLSGSEDMFAHLMNQKAKDLGLTKSSFKNATGLPHPEHLMSAHDLAVLARAIIQQFPEYYSIYGEKEFTYNKIKQGNRNPLLYTMNGADGLKTGHTQASGYGLTGSAKTNDGRRLIMVLNGLKTMQARSDESQKLMGYGIAGFENLTLFTQKNSIEQMPVWYGKAESVSAVVDKDVIVTVARGQGKNIKADIKYTSPIQAPIHKGQKIGDLVVTMPDGQIIRTDLVSYQDIEKVGYFGKVKKFILSFLGK